MTTNNKCRKTEQEKLIKTRAKKLQKVSDGMPILTRVNNKC